MNIVLEAGGEDLRDDGENWEVITDPAAFDSVLQSLKKANIAPTVSEVAMIPQNYIKLEGQAANTMIRLMDTLEDHDDVQHVYANFDIDEQELAAATK